MQQNVPDIFDRKLLRMRRKRAASHIEAFDFLLRPVAEELALRLTSINRRFTHGLIYGGFGGILAHMPEISEKIEHIICADLCAEMLPPRTINCIADQESSPFAPACFDVIICFWNLHMVNDVPGALLQMRRALKPDGVLLAAYAGGESLSGLRHAFIEAESALSNGLSPRIHPFSELQQIAAMMQRTGFALPVIDHEPYTLHYRHARDLLTDLRGMGESNILTARARTPLRRAILNYALEIYRHTHQTPHGKISAHFDVHFLTGWAPHASHPKPLAPGSAKMRLADALNTSEVPLKGK